ncbi:MAG: tyrosine-type recombinase/integrase [Alphaproteobacteria bacterium]|nr:tyrosine-type recombinase/integrase [Alphaproteobacteria bacterium]
MPKPRPPYLQKQITRHGKTVWYVRKGEGPRIRIAGEFGTEDFNANYINAVESIISKPKIKVRTASLQWLWDTYMQSSAWADLSPATRKQRENIMLHVLESAGVEPYGQITSETIEDGKSRRRETPSQARNFLDCMRGLFRWAKDAGHNKTDPTLGVKNPKKRRSKGFPAWTEDDVEAYQRKWPLGTKERVWLDVLLYTGPRRGDVVKLGKQHERMEVDPYTGATIRVVSFRTEKGGETIEVTIPILPVLQTTLDAGPTGDLAYVCGDRGTPLTKESFGNAFSAAARAAGVKKSAHGVRKIAATTAADNGATVHQLMSIFGWKTTQMAEFYTREANRKRLAREAIHTLSRTLGQQTIPSPSRSVPLTLGKPK